MSDTVPVTQADGSPFKCAWCGTLYPGAGSWKCGCGPNGASVTITPKPAPSPAPLPEDVERICGSVMPDRLWMVDMGSGDVIWSAERNPDGEEPDEAVEYVRRAKPALDREALKVAMVDAARARGGAGAQFIADGHTNLWLDIAYDAILALTGDTQ